MEQSINHKNNIATSILSLTNELVNKYKARITGSHQCLEAGHQIADILKNIVIMFMKKPFFYTRVHFGM